VGIFEPLMLDLFLFRAFAYEAFVGFVVLKVKPFEFLGKQRFAKEVSLRYVAIQFP